MPIIYTSQLVAENFVEINKLVNDLLDQQNTDAARTAKAHYNSITQSADGPQLLGLLQITQAEIFNSGGAMTDDPSQIGELMKAGLGGNDDAQKLWVEIKKALTVLTKLTIVVDQFDVEYIGGFGKEPNPRRKLDTPAKILGINQAGGQWQKEYNTAVLLTVEGAIDNAFTNPELKRILHGVKNFFDTGETLPTDKVASYKELPIGAGAYANIVAYDILLNFNAMADHGYKKLSFPKYGAGYFAENGIILPNFTNKYGAAPAREKFIEDLIQIGFDLALEFIKSKPELKNKYQGQVIRLPYYDPNSQLISFAKSLGITIQYENIDFMTPMGTTPDEGTAVTNGGDNLTSYGNEGNIKLLEAITPILQNFWNNHLKNIMANDIQNPQFKHFHELFGRWSLSNFNPKNIPRNLEKDADSSIFVFLKLYQQMRLDAESGKLTEPTALINALTSTDLLAEVETIWRDISDTSVLRTAGSIDAALIQALGFLAGIRMHPFANASGFTQKVVPMDALPAKQPIATKHGKFLQEPLREQFRPAASQNSAKMPPPSKQKNEQGMHKLKSLFKTKTPEERVLEYKTLLSAAINQTRLDNFVKLIKTIQSSRSLNATQKMGVFNSHFDAVEKKEGMQKGKIQTALAETYLQFINKMASDPSLYAGSIISAISKVAFLPNAREALFNLAGLLLTRKTNPSKVAEVLPLIVQESKNPAINNPAQSDKYMPNRAVGAMEFVKWLLSPKNHAFKGVQQSQILQQLFDAHHISYTDIKSFTLPKVFAKNIQQLKQKNSEDYDNLVQAVVEHNADINSHINTLSKLNAAYNEEMLEIKISDVQIPALTTMILDNIINLPKQTDGNKLKTALVCKLFENNLITQKHLSQLERLKLNMVKVVAEKHVQDFKGTPHPAAENKLFAEWLTRIGVTPPAHYDPNRHIDKNAEKKEESTQLHEVLQAPNHLKQSF